MNSKNTINIFDYDIKSQMLNGIDRYAGSFIKAIGQAIRVADDGNLLKLYVLFMEDLNRYYEMGAEK